MLVLIYFILRVLAAITSALYLYLATNPDELSKTIAGIFLAGASASVFESVRHNWGNIRLTLKIIRLSTVGQPLRISFASLIRVKIDDHFLLVFSKKWQQYSPAGGAYRYFDDNLKNEFQLSDDSAKALNVNELRLVFKGKAIWKVFSFIKWFESRRGRESDPHREFAEELISNGILSATTFADLMFQFDRTVMPDIDYSTGLQKHQLFAWEIFCPVLNDAQRQALNHLKNTPDSRYCFLTQEEIERDGMTNNGQIKIGSHTKYIL